MLTYFMYAALSSLILNPTDSKILPRAYFIYRGFAVVIISNESRYMLYRLSK